jgi:hypothetical protein
METADRAQLLDVATRFFHTGVRYAPFEKVLLETLLHLDYYNATKALRSKGTGLTTRVERGLLMAWAYRRTLGADPAYLLHVGLGGAGLFVTKVALLLGAAWWAFSHYDATGSRPALLALALVGVLVARWIGRSLVRMVVGWAAPPDRLAARFVYGTPVHESLQGLHDLVQLVSASGVAPTQLREALARSDAHVSIPPIVAAYLDRAIAEKEFLWPPPEKP